MILQYWLPNHLPYSLYLTFSLVSALLNIPHGTPRHVANTPILQQFPIVPRRPIFDSSQNKKCFFFL
jgi:hypothetical protein